jgi:hypothetical protein
MLRQAFMLQLLYLDNPLIRVEKHHSYKTSPDSQLDLIACLEVWLWLLFKVLFTQKSMPIIFFYFLKIIFDINTLG